MNNLERGQNEYPHNESGATQHAERNTGDEETRPPQPEQVKGVPANELGLAINKVAPEIAQELLDESIRASNFDELSPDLQEDDIYGVLLEQAKSSVKAYFDRPDMSPEDRIQQTKQDVRNRGKQIGLRFGERSV